MNSDIPNEPVMLLSYINTRLRDYYPSLDELCRSMNLQESVIKEKLGAIDYQYDEKLNKFV